MFSTQDLADKSNLTPRAVVRFLKTMGIEPSRVDGKTMFWSQDSLSILLGFGPKPRPKKPKQPIEPPVTRQEFDQLKIELAQVKHVLKLMHARISGA